MGNDAELYKELTEQIHGSLRIGTDFEFLYILVGPTPCAYAVCPVGPTARHTKALVGLIEAAVLVAIECADKPKTYAALVRWVKTRLRKEIQTVEEVSAKTKAKDPTTIADKPAKKEAVLKACACGCGGMAKATFIPGHDAKAHSFMRKVEAGELSDKEIPDVLRPHVMKCSECGNMAYKHPSGIGDICRKHKKD